MAVQRCFDDLGRPLAEVTFCVVDLETTGGSPAASAITEIGALKVRRGEVDGSFHTLVDPGTSVPAFIRLLTGITDELLADAPRVEAVLPSFLEFARNTVLVAHNARFDVGFLNAALGRAGYDPLSNRVVDTAALARKILAGEVPNNRLDTLARYLRCAHRPAHRAFPDVLATTDVLHHLIERVAAYGVTTLEDLLSISTAHIDGVFSKISLAADLPRGIGVYRFLGARGQTLYVGKASDVRSRVRSYFHSDPRRKVRDLLRETQRITAEKHATLLEAEVAEGRAIHAEMPPYNRAGKRTATWYVKIALLSQGRIAPARVVRDDGSVYLGPFPSMRAARALIDAIRDAAPIHRCATPERCGGCAFSDLGTCSGTDRQAHRAQIEAVARAVATAPGTLLAPLVARMQVLARSQRYEEAAEVRDRGDLLETVLYRAAEVRALVAAGDIVIDVRGTVLRIRDGVLFDATSGETGAAAAREARVICSWLRKHAGEVRVLSVTGAWALPVGIGPAGRFKPAPDP